MFKKNSQQTHQYMWVTEILKFYEFYFVHIVKVCFVLKNSHDICILPYMHKTLPTLGNEKEQQQIKFYENLLSKLIFLQATKNLKILYFFLPDWASAQKVGLHHCTMKFSCQKRKEWIICEGNFIYTKLSKTS